MSLEPSRLLIDLAPFDDNELPTVLKHASRLHPDDLARLAGEVQRWGATATEAQKGQLRDVVRAGIRHGSLHKATKKTLKAVDDIQSALEPLNPIERHRWLFKEYHVTWHKLDEDEVADRITGDERHTTIMRRRVAALRDIEAEFGFDGLFSFAISVGTPEVVAQSLINDNSTDPEAVLWVERCMQNAQSEAARKLMQQLFWCKVRGNLRDFISGYVNSHPLQDGDKEVLAECLPGVSHGWDSLPILGDAATRRYWQTVRIQGFDDNPDDMKFAVSRLLDAGRPGAAYAAARFHPEKLPSDLWCRVLRDIPTRLEADSTLPQEYDLTEILKYLDRDESLTLEDIARIELPYAEILCQYGHRDYTDRTLALHRVIAKNPADFIFFLSCQYRRSDGADDPDFIDVNDIERAARFKLAYQIFSAWRLVPGENDQGIIDADVFMQWSLEALRLAEEAGRLRPAQHALGDLFAELAKRRGFDAWLPEVVLDLLEAPEQDELRRGFWIGVENARGVTSRGVYEGGGQERDLANNYRQLAARFSNSHPHVSATLIDIAKSYEHRGKREDEQAALGERWHP